MSKKFEQFLKNVKSNESGPVFNEAGKLIGFVDFKKPSGQNQGYDCPIFDFPKEETDKERLKRISKPKLTEMEND
jgi:hypothetical protein